MGVAHAGSFGINSMFDYTLGEEQQKKANKLL